MAQETVLDGIREIKEEIGIDVSINELESLGVINYCVVKENFIDKEIAYVFLYRYNNTFEEFTLQKEEVSGMLKTEFDDFYELWIGDLEQISVKGFKIDSGGNRVLVNKIVERNQFVPHEISFYQSVVKLIKEKIQE